MTTATLRAGAASPRAILYGRVSTTQQSADMQLDALRAEAQRRGWTVVAECVDTGWSGRKDRRPELDRAMGIIRSDGADVLAVWRFDRLARSVRHLLAVLDELRERGVDFVSITEGVATDTPLGRAMFTIISSIAELEADLIRERVTAGVRRAIARGKAWGRPRRATPELVGRARALRDAGRSWRSIAMAVGVPVRTIRRALAAEDAVAKARPAGEEPATQGEGGPS